MEGWLTISDQGQFWVGLSRERLNGEVVAGAAMYVQYQVPAEPKHPYPVVMVHGGGGQGTDFLGTPDGRPGWATRFVQQGFSVYVVDRPGFGRSPCHPAVMGAEAPPPTYGRTSALFSAPAEANEYPNAALHTQWPGDGELGDPALDQFMAGQSGIAWDMERTQEAMRECGAQLLDRIGPAVLLTHSMGGPFGWVVADSRPDLVRGIVAVEPVGPPFAELPGGRGGLPWGITSVRLTFDPPAARPSEIDTRPSPAPEPGLVDCLLQREPARRLPNLGHFPIAVVTAEASWMARHGHGVVDFLGQAGARVEHLRLAELGIRGNGHLMMGEKNSDEIARMIIGWISRNVRDGGSPASSD